jgi:hypothetical protein
MRRRLRSHREEAARLLVIDLRAIDLTAFDPAKCKMPVRTPPIAQDEEGALEFGHRMYAGAVVLVLSGLLQQFRGDIGASAAMRDCKCW